MAVALLFAEWRNYSKTLANYLPRQNSSTAVCFLHADLSERSECQVKKGKKEALCYNLQTSLLEGAESEPRI